MTIRFLRAVPAIIGIDMKTYGPFKAEDLASMPVENAENLIRRGIAKEVEIQR
jgi:DNA replication factor GINS